MKPLNPYHCDAVKACENDAIVRCWVEASLIARRRMAECKISAKPAPTYGKLVFLALLAYIGGVVWILKEVVG